jgi:hypothetical protein
LLPAHLDRQHNYKRLYLSWYDDTRPVPCAAQFSRKVFKPISISENSVSENLRLHW